MEMTPVEVVAGDTATVEFAFRTQEIDGTLSAIDLTGGTTEMVVKDARGGTTLATYSGTITDATGGLAKYTVSETTPGTKWYQITTTITGATQTVAYGPLTVLDV